MNLIAVASPQNESDLAVMLCLLEANDIPAYVHNNGFGGLKPGPQINMLNNGRVTVTAIYVEDAVETWSVLEKSRRGTSERDASAGIGSVANRARIFPVRLVDSGLSLAQASTL